MITPHHNTHIIIPARLNSNRLEGKLALKYQGKEVLAHTILQAQKSSAKSVVVATDSELIQSIAQRFNCSVVLDSRPFNCGSDRCAGALDYLNLKDNDIVINWQADEPQMPIEVVDDLAQFIYQQQLCQKSEEGTENHFLMASVMTDLTNQQADDTNAVKVVVSHTQRAIYFSRAKIAPQLAHLHLGIYAFNVASLKKFHQWQQSSLEQSESLEQLRTLAHNHTIHMLYKPHLSVTSINTLADLKALQSKIT